MIGMGHHALLTMPGWNPRKLEIQFKTRVSPYELEQLKQNFPETENQAKSTSSKVKTTRSNLLLNLLSPFPENAEATQGVQLNAEAFATLLSNRYGCSKEAAQGYIHKLKSFLKITAVISFGALASSLLSKSLRAKINPAWIRNYNLAFSTIISAWGLFNNIRLRQALGDIKYPDSPQKSNTPILYYRNDAEK